MNSTAQSKINWTALTLVLVNVAATADLLPKQYEQSVLEIVNIAGPTMIGVFRTWFTGGKT